MKKILIFLSVVSSVFAFSLGDSMPKLTLKDQFDKNITLNSSVSTVMFTDDMKSNDLVKKFLKSKKEGFLERNHTIYLVDLTGMPGFIRSMFVMPKLKKYKFKLYLLDDASAKYFTQTNDSIAIYSFENGKFKSLKKFHKQEELEKFFKLD